MPDDSLVDDSPSLRPVLFVLALFVAAVLAAAGTTGLAASRPANAHPGTHHTSSAKVLLAAPSGAGG